MHKDLFCIEREREKPGLIGQLFCVQRYTDKKKCNNKCFMVSWPSPQVPSGKGFSPILNPSKFERDLSIISHCGAVWIKSKSLGLEICMKLTLKTFIVKATDFLWEYTHDLNKLKHIWIIWCRPVGSKPSPWFPMAWFRNWRGKDRQYVFVD